MLLPALCASLILAMAAAPALANPLAGERWNKRIVLIFADRPGGALDQQVDLLLRDREGLAERDMLVLAIAGDDVTTPFGAPMLRPEPRALRAAYAVPYETVFTILLLGKDGGEKLRRDEPATTGEIFGLIDSMPMRRQERTSD